MTLIYKVPAYEILGCIQTYTPTSCSMVELLWGGSATNEATPSSFTFVPDPGPETYRHLVIGLGAGITIAPITLCLLVIWVKRCRKKPQEENEDDEDAGDQNEDYGIYYSPQGERVVIESEVTDFNPYYETGGE